MSGIDFVSLFSGAGGLDLGLEAAGLRCVYASDNDQAAYETLLANRTNSPGPLGHAVLDRIDVSTLSGSSILALTDRRRGDVPLLAGGPPCQSWSSAGHQKGWLDPRGRLFDDFVRIASELDVRWLMFENVRGLLTARGPDGVPGSALMLIRQKLLKAGFQTHVSLLNAADYGVPQRRVRIIVFGYRAGDGFTVPDPTHSKHSVTSPGVSMASTFSKLDDLSPDEIIKPNATLGNYILDLAA